MLNSGRQRLRYESHQHFSGRSLRRAPLEECRVHAPAWLRWAAIRFTRRLAASVAQADSMTDIAAMRLYAIPTGVIAIMSVLGCGPDLWLGETDFGPPIKLNERNPIVLDERLYGTWFADEESLSLQVVITPWMVMVCNQENGAYMELKVLRHDASVQPSKLNCTKLCGRRNGSPTNDAGTPVDLAYELANDVLNVSFANSEQVDAVVCPSRFMARRDSSL